MLIKEQTSVDLILCVMLATACSQYLNTVLCWKWFNVLCYDHIIVACSSELKYCISMS